MRIYQFLPDCEVEELNYIQSLVYDMDENKLQQFASIYRSRRKNPQHILFMTLVGFLGISGIQRFYVEQIGMGLLYFFTGGLCLIGTIVDLVEYKRIALRFNQTEALQTALLVKNY